MDFATGGTAMGLAIGDLDGDGRPDLATANETPMTASVLLNLGGGTFGAPSTNMNIFLVSFRYYPFLK